MTQMKLCQQSKLHYHWLNHLCVPQKSDYSINLQRGHDFELSMDKFLYSKKGSICEYCLLNIITCLAFSLTLVCMVC